MADIEVDEELVDLEISDDPQSTSVEFAPFQSFNRMLPSDIASSNFDGSITRGIYTVEVKDVVLGNRVYLNEDLTVSLSPVETDDSYVVVAMSATGASAPRTFSVIKDGEIVTTAELTATTSIRVYKEDWASKNLGTSGWLITSEGNAIFANVAARGQIEADSGYLRTLDVNGVLKINGTGADDAATNVGAIWIRNNPAVSVAAQASIAMNLVNGLSIRGDGGTLLARFPINGTRAYFAGWYVEGTGIVGDQNNGGTPPTIVAGTDTNNITINGGELPNAIYTTINGTETVFGTGNTVGSTNGFRLAVDSPSAGVFRSRLKLKGTNGSLFFDGDNLSITGGLTATTLSVGGVNGINYDGTSVTIGSSVTIAGSLTASSVNINANNYWNSDGKFRTGNATNYLLFDPAGSGSLTINGSVIGSGQFNNGAISGSTIIIGSGTSVFKADTNGIYLGNETFASAPFRVTPAGALTATSATITGTIRATDGFIGGTTSGWDINSGSIVSSGGTAKITLDAVNAKIYIGTGTYGNANTPFYADGASQFSLGDKLTFTGGNLSITGAITATSGTFTGTITGSTFRTSANTGNGSTAGVIIDATSARFFNNASSTAVTTISTTDGSITSTNGTFTGGTFQTATGVGTGSPNATAGVIFNSSGIRGFSGAGTTPTFSLSTSGALTASNATISGDITATSGSFTGTVTIATGGLLRAGSVTDGVAIDSTGLYGYEQGNEIFKIPTTSSQFPTIARFTVVNTAIYSGGQDANLIIGTRGFAGTAGGSNHQITNAIPDTVGGGYLATLTATGSTYSNFVTGQIITGSGGNGQIPAGAYVIKVNSNTSMLLGAPTQFTAGTVTTVTGVGGYNITLRGQDSGGASPTTPSAIFTTINGTATSDSANNGFYVDRTGKFRLAGANGSVTMDGSGNLSVTGTITARAGGNIGGFTVGTNALSAGTSGNIVGLIPGSTTAAIFAGATSADGTGAQFKVTNAGVLTATGANISGAITATSGSFTGYMTAGNLRIGSNVNSTNEGIYINANNYWYDSGSFSIGDGTSGVTWNGTTLAISGTVTISGTAASTVVSNAATGSTALQPGSAASDVNNNVTTISGNKIRTGTIESTGYAYTSGNFSDTGTQINLSNGLIRSKNFLIDSSGNAFLNGTINATAGTFGSDATNKWNIGAGNIFYENASQENTLFSYDFSFEKLTTSTNIYWKSQRTSSTGVTQGANLTISPSYGAYISNNSIKCSYFFNNDPGTSGYTGSDREYKLTMFKNSTSDTRFSIGTGGDIPVQAGSQIAFSAYYKPLSIYSKSISAATGNGVSITFTCNNHSFKSGDQVVISGTTGFNGTFDISSTPNNNSFTVTNSTIGTWSGSGLATLVPKAIIKVLPYDSSSTALTSITSGELSVTGGQFTKISCTGTLPANTSTIILQIESNERDVADGIDSGGADAGEYVVFAIDYVQLQSGSSTSTFSKAGIQYYLRSDGSDNPLEIKNYNSSNIFSVDSVGTIKTANSLSIGEYENSMTIIRSNSIDTLSENIGGDSLYIQQQSGGETYFGGDTYFDGSIRSTSGVVNSEPINIESTGGNVYNENNMKRGRQAETMPAASTSVTGTITHNMNNTNCVFVATVENTTGNSEIYVITLFNRQTNSIQYRIARRNGSTGDLTSLHISWVAIRTTL